MLGFSMLGSIIVYRSLASGSLDMAFAGQFAISMAIVRILTNSVGGAADLVVLRRVPVLYRSDPDAASDVVRTAFLLRLAAAICVVVAALVMQNWFADRFLHGAAYAPLVPLICVAAIGELLLRSELAWFQATERFDRFIVLEGVFQTARFLITLVLAATDTLSVTAILVTYAVTGLCATVLGATQLPKSLFTLRAIPGPIIREAAGFFCWTVFAFGLAASTERLDLFLLGRFRGAQDVGLYGGVLTLAVIPDFVGGLLVTVLQPRVIRLHESGGLLAFNRKLAMGMIPLGLLAIGGVVFAADLIISLALGPRFAAGATAFIVLAVASITWLVVTPVPAMLISMTAPRTTTALTVVQLIILVVGAVFLIPSYGATGAAVLVAGTRIGVAIAILVIGLRMMRHPGGAATLSPH
jgi:O-antigen/teichoic acid export membrane protein